MGVAIKEFLENQQQKDTLRFITCGSVDDGKSTLIGRLLYDSKSIFEDQWDAVEQSSKQRGDENVNLALLTDGLRAEREQGITIDVAYRYFATSKRKFILADTPGHVQYTRNMVTGASTANLALMAGVPVIAAGHGAVPELVAEGLNGALFEPGNARSLAEAMRRLLDDGIDMQARVDDWPANPSLDDHVRELVRRCDPARGVRPCCWAGPRPN